LVEKRGGNGANEKITELRNCGVESNYKLLKYGILCG